MARTQPQDEGIKEIAQWHRWFLTAHVQRLRDAGCDEDTVARESIELQRLAGAIADQLAIEYPGIAREAPVHD